MRRQELRSIAPRRFRPQTTDSRRTVMPSPNLLLDLSNAPQQPGQVIVGDITYLPPAAGKWSYLATWQDTFSKRVLGWEVADSMTDELVVTRISGELVGAGVPGDVYRDLYAQFQTVTGRHAAR